MKFLKFLVIFLPWWKFAFRPTLNPNIYFIFYFHSLKKIEHVACQLFFALINIGSYLISQYLCTDLQNMYYWRLGGFFSDFCAFLWPCNKCRHYHPMLSYCFSATIVSRLLVACGILVLFFCRLCFTVVWLSAKFTIQKSLQKFRDMQYFEVSNLFYW